MPVQLPLTAAQEGSKTAYGFWLTFPSSAVARTILRSAATSTAGKFSWVLIDAEHGLISDKDYYELASAIAAEGASPIIRIPWAEEWMIKRALDAGAHGVLTPMCHTAEDAAKIVKFSKYPSKTGGIGGSRGYGPMFAIHTFPGVAGGADYDDSANSNLVVAVQIESKQGVANVDAIAAVPGLDILLIGPFDLALQMGVERGGAEHEAAIQSTLAACKKHGKKAAIFCSNGEQAAERAAQGFDMVSVITDVGALGEVMTQQLSTATGAAKLGPRDGY
ncbi:dihydroxyhept-2-ene- -dioic acid aldolase [Ophiostoma piceae UAMH 11346]|uniref:Dihydroxyhept-2-ene--dioic acid aldolase n=1 Tax=Ophiostoma piceae (strain UAMH 11346) TaxID=1262450 RepID=S3BPE4_OPHP1|nr:dihydroxyhept-2-ene- -dioic acid aldolase [Ophiostoma piceae UAMH 11346]